MKKKLFAYALSGALTLGAVGGTMAYASDSSTTESTETMTESAAEKRSHGLSQLDEATQAEVKAIQDRVKSELEELGVEFPEKSQRQNPLDELDEATKTEAEAIFSQLKDGSLTKEEAQEQLSALGIEAPEKQQRHAQFDGLDEATQAEAKDILEQVKDGTLTREEAQTALEALGVSLPERSGEHDLFADLDEATAERAQALVDEAEAELAELGVDRSLFGNQHHGKDRGHGKKGPMGS